jgi:hypothetical protein
MHMPWDQIKLFLSLVKNICAAPPQGRSMDLEKTIWIAFWF